MAEVIWDSKQRLGLCWNGDLDDPNDAGNPRSHRHGTWFIVPDPIARYIQLGCTIVSLYNKHKEQIANDPIGDQLTS